MEKGGSPSVGRRPSFQITRVFLWLARQICAKSCFKQTTKENPWNRCGSRDIFWSVRPIKMFAKTLYLQGFAGQRRLFFLFFGWDLADFLPKGDFSVRPKKISAYSYFFSF